MQVRGWGRGFWLLKDFWTATAAPEPDMFQVAGPSPSFFLLLIRVPADLGGGPELERQLVGWLKDGSRAL